MSQSERKKRGGRSDPESSEGENYAKILSSVVMKKSKPDNEQKISGGKIEFNPALHLKKPEIKPTSSNRFLKRDKQKKEKRKAVEKEASYMHDYNDLLLENLLKKYYTTKSPHLIISRRWFEIGRAHV